MESNGTNVNGQNRLEAAMAMLIQNEATFVARQSDHVHRHLEYERERLEFERKHYQTERETAERFVRIEAQMIEIIRVLTEHSKQLERLTDAVRDRIGFKG